MELELLKIEVFWCLRQVGSHSKTQHDILEEMNDSASFVYSIKY